MIVKNRGRERDGDSEKDRRVKMSDSGREKE